MPSDPFTFTEPHVLGAIRCQWRAVRRPDGGLRVDRRVMPDGARVELTAAKLEAEVAHETDAGG